MVEDSYKRIIADIDTVAKIDASICKSLALACMSIKDDSVAEMLLKRLRNHVALTVDGQSMYKVSYYLSYIEDLLDLTGDFAGVEYVNSLRNAVQSIYEKFLDDKMQLMAVLGDLEYQNLVDGLRENYWIN